MHENATEQKCEQIITLREQVSKNKSHEIVTSRGTSKTTFIKERVIMLHMLYLPHTNIANRVYFHVFNIRLLKKKLWLKC